MYVDESKYMYKQGGQLYVRELQICVFSFWYMYEDAIFVDKVKVILNTFQNSLLLLSWIQKQ